MYWIECGLGPAPKHASSIDVQVAHSVLRTARANPHMPLCVFTGMGRERVLNRFESALGGPLAAMIGARLAVVDVPCRCTLASQFLPTLSGESGVNDRKELELIAATRYSRQVKVLAAAYVPFSTTIILDADASLCANAPRAIVGVSEALAITNKSIGARFHKRGRFLPKEVNRTCEEACAQAIDGALVRSFMRCAALCAGRSHDSARDGCGANTGVLIVRKTPDAANFARTWYQRWLAQISKRRNGSALAFSGDQRSFGSSGRRQRSTFAAACRTVANIPRELHMGRGEVAQGQHGVLGPVVAVHGCKAQERDKGSCPLYDACCSRRGKCADVVFPSAAAIESV